jgi:arabinogalactan oligomer/maltooligosaccharide transport system permease protein
MRRAALAAGFFCALGAVTQTRVTLAAAPISLWHSYRGDEERALAELAQRYEREAGVPVHLLSLPFDVFLSKLKAAVPNGNGPDLFIDAHQRVGTYAKEHVVVPENGAFPEGDVERYDAIASRAVVHEGQRFGVPLATKCTALYYHPQLLPVVPSSLDALVAMRATLPSGTYPLAYESGSVYFHAGVLHAFGGELYTAEGKYGFVGPAAARSVDAVVAWQRSGALPLEPNGALVTKLFAEGKAAAVISGPWLVAELGEGIDYRVAPLPRVSDSEGGVARPFLTVDTVFSTPRGQQRSDAQAFARWLGGDSAAEVRARVGHQVVATRAVWQIPAVAADERLHAFHEAALQAVAMPTASTMQATWSPAERALKKALRGDAPTAVALTEGLHRFEDDTRPAPPRAKPTPALFAAGMVLLGLAFLLFRRMRDVTFRRELTASLPAYKWVAHCVVAVLVLVIAPLFAGALTSFFAGTRFDGYYVGLANYLDILTARGRELLGHGSFYLALLVTVLWTAVNLFFHVSLGLLFGIALSRPTMRFSAVYRVLLIVPWAIPNYVTALAWKGMFHRQFGAINRLLEAVGATPVAWFSHFTTAFTANVLTNVWLGFPFMMVVTMGALTSIPREVLEAAEVDGATRWQRFRLVTMPLLLPALVPSIVLGAVWTFNMFNVIFLVSGGEPDGSTDILVSDAYRWAFTRDAQMGYAAAYAVLIFLLLTGITRATRRFTAEGTT